MCGVTGQLVSLVGTVFSTASRIKSQQAAEENQREQLRQRLLQEEYNQNAARERAKIALANGEVEAEQQRREAARKQGEQTSLLAASGFELDSGSTESLLAEGAEEAAHANARIRHRSAMDAWNQQNAMVESGSRQNILRLKRDSIADRDDQTQSLLGGLNSISRK